MNERQVRILSLVVLLGVVAGCGADPSERPRLVVVVVVDQMRADYLTRFGDRFDGGLSRLTSEGAVFGDAHWSHALTLTAPGHASLATGTTPARHGIVGNLWLDRETGLQVYAGRRPRRPWSGAARPT